MHDSFFKELHPGIFEFYYVMIKVDYGATKVLKLVEFYP